MESKAKSRKAKNPKPAWWGKPLNQLTQAEKEEKLEYQVNSYYKHELPIEKIRREEVEVSPYGYRYTEAYWYVFFQSGRGVVFREDRYSWHFYRDNFKTSELTLTPNQRLVWKLVESKAREDASLSPEDMLAPMHVTVAVEKLTTELNLTEDEVKFIDGVVSKKFSHLGVL